MIMPLGRRLIIGAFVLVGTTSITAFVAANRWLRPALEENVATLLMDQALLIAASIGPTESDLNRLAHENGELIGRRVTFIDSLGKVVGDSDFDDLSLSLLENHLNRPEINALLAGRPGVHMRRSSSTNRDEMKVAIEAWPGFVRISAPLVQVEEMMRDSRRAVLLAGALALLVGLTLATLSGRALGRPIANLAVAANAVARRQKVEFPTSEVSEIRDLVTSFRSMDAQLGRRINQLANERQETSTILESMAQGVLSLGKDGQVRYSNDAAREILGISDIGIANIKDILRSHETRTTFNTVMRGSVVEEHELEINDRHVLTSARPLPNGGAVMGLLDITDLKRAHEVRKDFVANVSHELKTPLTNILGYSETLVGDDLDEPTRRQFLSVINRNSRRMQRIVDDLLDLATIESGSWSAKPQALVLADLIRESWANVSDGLQPDVIFETDINPPDLQLCSDPNALVQVLTNLFNNAARYTSRGSIKVSGVETSDGVAVEVSDTGSGIASEHISRIFERFYRSDPARSREEGGTGLGLSIVKHLIEAQGGTIALTSTLGTGTKVKFVIPKDPTGA